MATGICKICGFSSDVVNEETGVCVHCDWKTKFIKDRWLNKDYDFVAIKIRKKWAYFKKI